MAERDRSRTRREEIEAILEHKPGTREAPDEADRYTVVGAASRRTFENWLTPVAEHFVCHRNDIPDADAEAWEITVAGNDETVAADEEESTLSMEAIRRSFPTVATAHTMECAGNNRGQHEPSTGSVQWGFEAVATAIWTGTPVRSVLRDCGVDLDDAGDRWLTVVGGDPPADDQVYVKSIPLEKALDDCVLAYEMNGRTLPPEHGYPVRLVVPGWYGTNSVKWVDQLRVTGTMVSPSTFPDDGRSYTHWQHGAYRLHPSGVDPEMEETVPTADTWDQLRDPDVAHPYTFDETVMSLIGRPDGESTVVPDEDGRVEIRGVAWAGDDRVSRIEVSTDDGASWADADRYGPDYDGAWRLFDYTWEPDGGGETTLLSRATDEHGRTQPARIEVPDDWGEIPEDAFPWNEGGYAANAYRPNGVTVRVGSDSE